MELPKQMNFADIMNKLPFLTTDDPLLYHIYASVNKLNEKETEEIQKTIHELKMKRDYLNESHLKKCKITADFTDYENKIL